MANLQDKPLTGVRILEFGGYMSGPYGSSLLCALGADVVKVERTKNGDDFRRKDENRNPFFAQYNAGKRSLSVDLKSPDGVHLIKQLLPRFDVVVENMRPGKIDALGLGAQECMRINPDLIFTSVSGFGEGGPLKDRPAYDTIGQAFSGMYAMLSDRDEPQLPGAIFADLVTGLTTATGILAALVGRGTGRGRHVQTSLMEAMTTLTVDGYTQFFEEGESPTRTSRHSQAQNFCLATRGPEYIALHLSSSQKFWEGLATAMDRADLLGDARFGSYDSRMKHYSELESILKAEFVRRTYGEWSNLLTDNDVPFALVHSIESWARDEQTSWLELTEPPRDGVSLVRPPWRFDGSRPGRASVAPMVGEHSIEVAGEVLDFSHINTLVERGVLYVSASEHENAIES